MSRAKKVPHPGPPRDPRLVALAEQAERAGWTAEWQLNGSDELGWWLRLRTNGVVVDAFGEDGTMTCYASYTGHWIQPARTPTEAMRSAYAALGVALDQAEDAFGQVQEQEQEQGEVK